LHLLAWDSGRVVGYLVSFVAGLSEEQRAEATTAAQRWPAR
jgi:hypothetical protein